MYQISMRVSSMEDYIVSAHLIPLIFEFCGKEFVLLDPRHEAMVAFLETEISYPFIRHPFQFAFG